MPLCRLNCRSAIPSVPRNALSDALRRRVQSVQIVAEHLDGHVGRLAGHAFADPVAQEGHHLTLQAGVARQNFAARRPGPRSGPRRHRASARHGIRSDAAPGVLAQARRGRPAARWWHVGQASTSPLMRLPTAIISSSEVPGNGAGHLHHEVAFAEVRHEAAAKKRQHGDAATVRTASTARTMRKCHRRAMTVRPASASSAGSSPDRHGAPGALQHQRHSAGVAVSATPNEASTAKMKASASGPTK